MEDMFCQSPRWMKVSLVSFVLIGGNIGLRWNRPAFVSSSLHRAKSQTLRAVSLPRSLLSRRRRSCGEESPWVQSAFEKSAVGLSRYVSRVLPAADFHFRPAVLGCNRPESTRARERRQHFSVQHSNLHGNVEQITRPLTTQYTTSSAARCAARQRSIGTRRIYAEHLISISRGP